jgi:hypothetical protein
MTWAVPGDIRPLSQRFDLAAAELRRLGGTPIFPATEIALQQMQKEIARLTPKPVPPPEPDFFVKRAENVF